MKSTVNLETFLEGFKVIRPDNFSRKGLVALFEYFEELEEGIGEELEFDPIAFCCGYTEYATLAEAANEYGITPSELVERTLVITFGGGVIVENF